MAPMKQLSSRHHPLVAACKSLARGRSGDDGTILLDGFHLVSDAVRSGLRLRMVAVTAYTRETPEGLALLHELEAGSAELVEVSDSMMKAISPVTTPSGIVAIASRPAWSLDQVFDRPPQLVVVGADVQEPGNAGAIVRAAEACGATGVAFCGASADPFGWKALRGSMGSALRLPVASAASVEDVFSAARRRGVRLAATRPRGGLSPRSIDLTQPVAFVLGGEGPGLPPSVFEAADFSVSLPMREPVESLNVAVAAALLVYEAANQRGPS
jgi:RNA methyltransferase, TrmH family